MNPPLNKNDLIKIKLYTIYITFRYPVSNIVLTYGYKFKRKFPSCSYPLHLNTPGNKGNKSVFPSYRTTARKDCVHESKINDRILIAVKKKSVHAARPPLLTFLPFAIAYSRQPWRNATGESSQTRAGRTKRRSAGSTYIARLRCAAPAGWPARSA